MFRIRSLGAMLVALGLVTGCAKNYVVTNPLSTRLVAPAPCAIGNIVDELPADMEEGKKPTVEDVDRLKRYLGEELARAGVARILPAGNREIAYEITGSFLEFKRGSGAVRFFIGFGLGTANATIGLRLVDPKTGTILFGGNFTGQVSSWVEGGDEMFRRIAKDFAKELAKQLKKVAPDTKLSEEKSPYRAMP